MQQSSSPVAIVTVFVKGFLMGSADVVPGVSGGTVALVTGIYPTLVGAISTGSQALERLLRGSWGGFIAALRRVPWAFLLPLVIGAIAAVITLAGILETLIVEQPIRTAAAFFGLIAGTIVVAWRLIEKPRVIHHAIAGGVGLATFALFGLQSAATLEPALWAFFGAGAVAICAFILPGVSGSFLLLSMGMYQAVLGAVNDREVTALLVFATGADDLSRRVLPCARATARTTPRHRDGRAGGSHDRIRPHPVAMAQWTRRRRRRGGNRARGTARGHSRPPPPGCSRAGGGARHQPIRPDQGRPRRGRLTISLRLRLPPGSPTRGAVRAVGTRSARRWR